MPASRSYSPTALIFVALTWGGCGQSSPSPTTPPTASTPTPAVSAPIPETNPSPTPEPVRTIPDLPKISLSGGATQSNSPTTAATSKGGRREVVQALQTFNVLLGTWEGKTRKEFGGFSAVDEPVWIWDHRTEKEQPALVMTSAKSPYFRELRLTYHCASEKYQLTVKQPDGQVLRFEGLFSEPVQEFDGPDQRVHKKYKLKFNQVGEDLSDPWQIVLNQQENNRYLWEITKKKGGPDVVGVQRQGTSIAKADDDYGDRKCVVSGGLGTMQVSYKGKSYYVCCTGCKFAFEDDPESWIAEFEAKKKKAMKN